MSLVRQQLPRLSPHARAIVSSIQSVPIPLATPTLGRVRAELALRGPEDRTSLKHRGPGKGSESKLPRRTSCLRLRFVQLNKRNEAQRCGPAMGVEVPCWCMPLVDGFLGWNNLVS
jgi:hypothetical protein